jgi:hypothetical protein
MIASVEPQLASVKSSAPVDADLMGMDSSGKTLQSVHELDARDKSHLLARGMYDLIIDPAIVLPIPFQRRVWYKQIVRCVRVFARHACIKRRR